MHRVQHSADVIVGRDLRHAEQRLAIRRLAPLLERALIGQKRFRLHEEQRKRRQPDVGHRIDTRLLPLVGKAGADVVQA